MSGQQLHIAHRASYLTGAQDGRTAFRDGSGYRPQDGAAGTRNQKRAYALGYEAGWTEAQEQKLAALDFWAPGSAITGGTCVNRWPQESGRSEREDN